MRKAVTISLDEKVWKKFKIWCVQKEKVASREIESAIVTMVSKREGGNDGR